MREGLIHRAALDLVERQESAQEVNGERRRAGKLLRERRRRLARTHALDRLNDQWRVDARHFIVCGRAQLLDDELQLLARGVALEHNFTAQQLGEEAADAPHVHGRAVDLRFAEQLRRAIPACDDVLQTRGLGGDGGRWRMMIEGARMLEGAFSSARACHPTSLHPLPETHLCQLRVARVRNAAREAEVAYGEVAVRVDEQIARFQVAVKHLGRVHKFQATQHLVREVLHVLLAEHLRGRNYALHVALEERHDNVQRMEILAVGWCCHHVEHFDDVVVLAEVAQQHDFAQDTLGIDEVREHAGRALNSYAPSSERVICRYDQAVRASADRLEVLREGTLD